MLRTVADGSQGDPASERSCKPYTATEIQTHGYTGLTLTGRVAEKNQPGNLAVLTAAGARIWL